VLHLNYNPDQEYNNPLAVTYAGLQLSGLLAVIIADRVLVGGFPVVWSRCHRKSCLRAG